METLDIAQISTGVYTLPPTGYAGIEAIVSDLSSELMNMGHDVTIVAPKGSVISGQDTCRVIETVSPSFNNDERGAYEIYKDKLDRFDVIHDHTHLKYIYTHPKANDMPICSTLHNQCNFGSPAPVKHMNMIGISSWQSIATSGMLGIPIKYVHNGIDPSKYEYNENKGDKFLFLSRIARFKGAHEAISMAKRAGLKLDVAGEDVFVNDPPYVHSIMSSCTGGITYYGNVQPSIKVSLLSNARALLLPLLWDEPFGIVALEALASGTPVITLNRGAMPEIIEHGKSGFVCNTIPEMYECLDKIDSIKPIDCRKRAEEFTVSKMANEYIKLYKQMLEGYEW